MANFFLGFLGPVSVCVCPTPHQECNTRSSATMAVPTNIQDAHHGALNHVQSQMQELNLLPTLLAATPVEILQAGCQVGHDS